MAENKLPTTIGEDKRYYVYLYRDVRPEREGVPIYVGKGRELRATAHLRAGRPKNVMFKNVLTEIAAAGLRPTIEIVSFHVLESDAYAAEAALIKTLGRVRDGGTLLNIDPGGFGGRKRPPSTIEKIRKAAVEQWKRDGFRDRTAQVYKDAAARPENRERMRAAAVAMWADTTRAEQLRLERKNRYEDSAYRERVRRAVTAATTTSEYRRKMSEIKKAHCDTPAFREQMSDIKKALYADPERRKRFVERRRKSMEASGRWRATI